MNKTTKYKSIKMKSLIVILIGILFSSQMMQAMANSTDPVAIVSNFRDFYSAMYNAKDGDVIGINGQIMLSSVYKYGYTDKHVILKRMSSSAFFKISSEVTFENVTFDGGEISTSTAYILGNGKLIFNNSTFKNIVNTNSGGGAVHIINNTADFYNCIFENNTAVEGGHIYVNNSGNVNIESCTLKDGHAVTLGGAITNAMDTGTINITSSIITGNSAERNGGGIFNRGTMTITGTKVFDNTAPNGADIANVSYANLNLEDSIETLVELFKDDGIIPTAWVNDYDGSTNLSGANIDPTASNSLLKLEYEIPPTEVTLSPSSLGTPGDGKVIGFESGKYYKVTMNDVISYSKADGSLTEIEAEASPLDGTEIIGLINGETYMIEEFTPAPTTVLLDSASLGTADNEKITGLTAGKMYKVSVDGTTNYTNADGTLTTIEAEATALEGTEIVGLTNGVTYLVKEYIPPVEEPIEEPTDPGTQPDPETPDDEDPIEEPTDPGTEIPTDDEAPDSDSEQQSSSNTTTTTTTTTTDSNNTSNTTTTDSNNTNTTNNTTTHNSDSRDDSSTVKNYDYSSHSTTENTYLPPSNDGSGEKGGQASASQNQTITVDYGSIADGIKVQDDGKDITINVNVNVGTNEKDEAEPQIVEVASSKVKEVPSDISNITWVELVKICLLFGIFICVFRRPIAK
ncbi:right-handed parallel beta-helix repeat-containing protein [Alkaliphilus serpentinus]|uniref:Right-handed parallel beta-helix repeat-containing protein n=1 Tax=Alkaliphilus serpentinus TaxID=1482731 RepID=A0A833HMT5_9FIRM|nr:right-handed parallel beta-helix repeat-containing protein [Alkaliphilus serpentinus]KAB3527112.1 right-handed parallel beta-helix repeat-containing protein [Alkaliphilus serpentinus]